MIPAIYSNPVVLAGEMHKIFTFQHQTILQGSNIQRLVWLYHFNLHSCQLHHLSCGETHHPTLVRVGKVFLRWHWPENCQVQGEKHPACVQHPVQLRVHRGDDHEGRSQRARIIGSGIRIWRLNFLSITFKLGCCGSKICVADSFNHNKTLRFNLHLQLLHLLQLQV